VAKLDTIQLEEAKTRIDKLEKRDMQDLLTLLEIMSNITFFGGLKKENCEYVRDGQCSFFHLQVDSKNKIPLANECRIQGCEETNDHCHLETSNVTCTFCPQWRNSHSLFESNKLDSSRRRTKRQEK